MAYVILEGDGAKRKFSLRNGKVKIADVLRRFQAAVVEFEDKDGTLVELTADAEGFSTAFENGATVKVFCVSAGAVGDIFDRKLQMIDKRLDKINYGIEELHLLTPQSFTAAVKDEVSGAGIMGRSDYSTEFEHKIFETFSQVDVSVVLAAFMQSFRPLAAKYEQASRKGKRGPEAGSRKRPKDLETTLKEAADAMADSEKTLQLGVKECLESLEGTEATFFDTSTGRMTGSPDILFSVVQELVTWFTVLMAGELKWDLGTITEEKKAIGQITARLRKVLATQVGRKIVFGFIADRRVIRFVGLDVSGGIEVFWWSRYYPFHFGARDETGFKLLLQMMYAFKSVHGYSPPMDMKDLALPDGRVIRDMSLFQFKGEPSSCLVYCGCLDGKRVVVKVCSTLEHELCFLDELEGIPGVLPVLGRGSLANGRSYMVMPLCKTLSNSLSAKECLSMVSQVAETIKLLSDRGVFHADISVGNIVYDNSRYYLIDFGSAVSGSDDDDQRTGCTKLFAALRVLEGKQHCLSSELESLMYVLVCLAMGGKVPWKFPFMTDDTSLTYRRALFLDEVAFRKKVLSCTKDALLREKVLILRNLFFKPSYQESVTYRAFCSAVALPKT